MITLACGYTEPHVEAEYATTQCAASAQDSGQPRMFSAYIDQIIRDISLEFHDSMHVTSNCTQARNLWRASGLDVADFVEILYIAREITRKRGNIDKLATDDTSSTFKGAKNRAPYFFRVIRNELRSLGTVPQSTQGRGR